MKLRRAAAAVPVVLACLTGPAGALVPPANPSARQTLAAANPLPPVSSSFTRASDVPGRAAQLTALGASHGFVDRRSGGWGTLVLRTPLLPGDGRDNTLSWNGPAPTGSELEKAAVEALRGWVAAHAAPLGLGAGELATLRATALDGGRLVHLFAEQQLGGVAVRDATFRAVVVQGNLVLLGTRNWLAATPPVASVGEAAARAAAALAVGAFTEPRAARLELVPVAIGGDAAAVAVGAGLGHRLAWVFEARFTGDPGTWEVLVDATTGAFFALVDRNQYLRGVVGGIFPISNDGVGPEGQEQPAHAMPFADARDGADALFFADSAGDLVCVADEVEPLTTTLSGRFVKIFDNCGDIEESATSGDIDLGTQAPPSTDCEVPAGRSVGDTHASRTGFYELNRLIEQAKGWLPENPWLQAQLTSNMNIEDTCNAFWNGSTVNFYQSGGGCRNTGEIAAVFDHEWGHGMDNNDADGAISAPGEAYADVAAILRLRTSCIGRGFDDQDLPCGGNGDPCLVCSGVREVDWDQRESHQPHDLDWINQDPPLERGGCKIDGVGSTSFGPCGFGTHCEGSAASEGVWDLLIRDLPCFPAGWNAATGTCNAGATPIDEATAHELVTRIFYRAGGGIGNWYNCNPLSLGGPGTYGDGCNADGAYLQFLAADDDDGDLADGTPHMSAIFAAWDRHQMACQPAAGGPAVTDSGCSGAPTAAPDVTLTPTHKGARLSWPPVPGAVEYWVYRTEGVLGCDLGKTRVGVTAGTSFLDGGLRNGREARYAVLAVGAGGCPGPLSDCTALTPVAGAALAFAADQASFSGLGPGSGDGDLLFDNCEVMTVEVPLRNIGEVPLTGLALLGVEVPSHPAVQVLPSSLEVVPATIPPCGVATARFRVLGSGLGHDDTVRFALDVTAAELGPSVLTRSFHAIAAESNAQTVSSQVFSWNSDGDYEGWRVMNGTFDHDTTVPSAAGAGHLHSSMAVDGACDQLRSPRLRLKADSTLSLANQFAIEPGTEVSGFYDRANVGVRDELTGGRTTVAPSTGRTYDASGEHGACVTAGEAGWAGPGPGWLQSGWTAADLNPGGAFTGRIVTLDIAYGTDPNVSGDGFRVDELQLSQFERLVPDTQTNSCSGPLAVPDFSGFGIGPVVIPVLANDIDPLGEGLEITAVTQPAHGTASFQDNAPGPDTVTFVWDGTGAGCGLADSFTYAVVDDLGRSAIGTVFLTFGGALPFGDGFESGDLAAWCGTPAP
jgi:hypothetical protein